MSATLQITEKAVVRAEAFVGTFTTLTFECAILPEEAEITGSVLIKDWAGTFETEQLSHIIQEEPTGSVLKFGTTSASSTSIDGLVFVEAYMGLPFGSMRTFNILK